MRRVAPGVAAVVFAGLAALTGCGSDAGAATAPISASAPAELPAAAPAATSGLAGLAAVPGGFLRGVAGDPTQATGPFTRQAFVDTLSAAPAKDLALLLNAGCKEGYQTFRVSPDRRKRVTVQLFKTASKPKALDLQKGFWSQTEHSKAFAVPGLPEALTDARTEVVGVTGRIEAVAEASITVGTMVAEVTVTQTGTLENAPVPDIRLATTILRLQQARLTTKSG
ncbi:hypothetical protein [Kribbella sp. CA-293567]|uniref:hypothetical protein n=1 Tax=Kribbella sp. CA-293567 TaxID=3002436 RepID=UPI0022DD19AD|nr:hypothetical protein [Kribbella sp. CA-293567]WBQ04139.1 hypothetical protein OX958_29745 [Kribbella sp. CA-293567]